MRRLNLHPLLIVLVLVAAVLAIGWLGMGQQRGVGRAVRSVKQLAPLVEERNSEVRDLASP